MGVRWRSCSSTHKACMEKRAKRVLRAERCSRAAAHGIRCSWTQEHGFRHSSSTRQQPSASPYSPMCHSTRLEVPRRPISSTPQGAESLRQRPSMTTALHLQEQGRTNNNPPRRSPRQTAQSGPNRWAPPRCSSAPPSSATRCSPSSRRRSVSTATAPRRLCCPSRRARCWAPPATSTFSSRLTSSPSDSRAPSTLSGAGPPCSSPASSPQSSSTSSHPSSSTPAHAQAAPRLTRARHLRRIET
mmetsp:Transcript_32590/g.71533  ORF Transcript_32590/g.71533 Transcript_32590/m.71533 type:complete len:244 (+) Transcript_32590:254-985(+)